MKTLKEVGSIMAPIKYLILLMVVFIECKTNKKLTTVLHPLYVHKPDLLKYDTLSAIFFYENSISSYEKIDVFVKSGGFIKTDTITQQSYCSGYYIGDASAYVKYLKQKGIIIRYDDASIAGFYDSLLQIGLRDGSYRSKTKINPFCGAYYKKFKLNVEVLFIDTISQRTPLFMDCNKYTEYVSNNKGKNYTDLVLPTYIITRVFSWKEL